MESKIVSGIMLTLLLMGMLTWAFNIQPVKASSINYRSFGSSVPPATEWNKTYGGSGGDGASSVWQTTDGGYIIAGTTGSFGTGADFWLVKTDAFGNEEWNRTYGGGYEQQARAVVQTSDKGYIVAGGARSPTTDKGDAWLVKTDEWGNMQWNKSYGGSGHEWGFSVQQTSEGGYVIAGVTDSYGTGGADFYLVKSDASGNMEWNKTYGGPGNEIAWSVQQASDGGYILAGQTWHSPFEAFTIDAWLIKTDSYGNVVWNKTLGRQEGHDRIYCVEKTNDGGYITAGGADRRDGYWRSGDFWLVKIDANGSIQWNKRYGDTDPFYGQYEEALSVHQTNDGGFIAVGNVYLDRYGDKTDIWLVKTDASGNMQWNNTYGGIYQDSACAVIQTNDRGYVIAGSSWLSLDRGTDFWLIKIMRANPPVASFTYIPAVPSVREKITFNASSSFDLDEDIVSYRWDFDDGNVSWRADSTIIHTFESPGIYNVTLTVIDSEGLNSSYSQIVWARIITFISISTSSASTFIGFSVNVIGTLSDMYGNGLENETVVLYYTFSGSDAWTPITSDTTDNLGNYFATWIPSTIGHFVIKAEWAGNQTHFGTYNVTDLDVHYIPTKISISLSSSTSYIGFKVEISGNLTYIKGVLSRTPILLSYSVTSGETWNDIMLVNTNLDGAYSAVWMPPATGNYLVKATWLGNSTYLGAATLVNLAVIPFEEQNVFSVISNSTVSYLAFNSTSRELSFTVTGPSGTTGYVNVYIAKTLVENIADVKVYLNGEQLDYTATSLDDSWLLHFTYLHSTHKVTISLGSISAPFIETPLGKVMLYGIPITAIVILIVVYVLRKKQRSP